MTVGTAPETLVSIAGLSKHFPVRHGAFRHSNLKAVDDVSFEIIKGETLALVGESGSGKSTLGRLLVHLTPPTAGTVRLAGENVTHLDGAQRKAFWRRVQMIFQDPYSSLNPRMTVGDTLREPLRNFGVAHGPEADQLVRKVLQDCGLSPRAINLYPREFSGGQRQRIGIARALIVRPEFIVADEPVSALDVSIQAQIINLLQDLQQDYQLTYLFIAHDLAVVRHIASRVAVMYRGRIVELAQAGQLYARPRHPYTQLLLRSVPIPDPVREAARIRAISTNEPAPTSGPSNAGTGGCSFRSRCPRAQALCFNTEPQLAPADEGHSAACHFPII